MLKTYRQTYRHTDRPSDEAGPRGAFAPKNVFYCLVVLRRQLIVFVCLSLHFLFFNIDKQKEVSELSLVKILRHLDPER